MKSERKHLSDMKGWKVERRDVIGGNYDYQEARHAYNRSVRRVGRLAIQQQLTYDALIDDCDSLCNHCLCESESFYFSTIPEWLQEMYMRSYQLLTMQFLDMIR